MLSNLSRGWSDGAVYAEDIHFKIDLMMKRASIPVLTNVQLQIPLSDVQQYPTTVPDLFVGGPLVCCMLYTV